MFLFHMLCLGVVLCMVTWFIIMVYKNNLPRNILYWLIIAQSILICIQQILHMIKYSVGG